LSWFDDSRRVSPTVSLCDLNEASSTALRLFSSPEPCSVAGAPRSVAVDSRICLITAGVGVALPWAFR